MDDALAVRVATTMATLTGRIPAPPARLLGRLGATDSPRHPVGGESASLSALRSVGALPAERLLGALELVVAGHDWTGAPDLPAGLPDPSPAQYVMVASGGHDSTAVDAAVLLERLRPGLADRTVALATALTAYPVVAGRLDVPAGATDEAALAAAHGTAYLSLAVAVAGLVVHQAAPPVVVERPAAVVGLAVGAAALLLRDAPMPPAYAAAALAKVRAEYLVPRHSHGSVTVSGHRFGLVENGTVAPAEFTGNGLVARVDGGLAVRTGVERGPVAVELVVLAEPPSEVESGWEETVDLSWSAAVGSASLLSPDGEGRRRETPPWPGDHRVRVHARGRDEQDAGVERYKLIVWAASATPEVVHQRTDRLGHRLRGEPEPARAARPEHAYRSRIFPAGTVTVVTGATAGQVRHAFGPGSARGVPLAVLDAGDAVLVVENNGNRGADADVLRAASVHGRAASMHRVDAVIRLSFAEGGRLIASFEPFGDEDVPPELAAVFAGLDIAEAYEKTGKGLVAVERFTGHDLTATDYAAISGM